MVEIVKVERAADLWPFDMLEEGRSIIRFTIGGGNPNPLTTGVARAVHERVNVSGTQRCVKRPDYIDVHEEPFPTFPTTVMRPGPIPDLPCPYCSADTTETGA